jgi:hypothetical protein
MTDIAAMVAAMRATSHVRRRGKFGWEPLTDFLARVGMTIEQCRTWSRQTIANHVHAAEAREKFVAEVNSN